MTYPTQSSVFQMLHTMACKIFHVSPQDIPNKTKKGRYGAVQFKLLHMRLGARVHACMHVHVLCEQKFIM